MSSVLLLIIAKICSPDEIEMHFIRATHASSQKALLAMTE